MANLQRIRTGSTGSLTPLERESLYELVKEYNSDFRVKTAAVPFVGDILPEAGAIVVSDHDGRMYYADQQGWNLMGVDSPIMLFVDYTDTQFDFKFKLPSTSYVEIHDGDGTSTIIQGQDDTLVIHTTTYSEAGTYTFFLEGDVTELTTINIGYQGMISGDISGWSALVNATLIRFLGTLVTGDISGFANIPTLLHISGADSNVHGDVSGYAALPTDLLIVLTNTDVSGDISGLVALTGSNNMQFSNSNVTGDISGFHVMSNLSFLWFDGCDVSFSEANDWSFDVGYGDEIKLENCGFTSTEVDNVLISFAGGTNSNFTMTLGGTNASRTSASDAALATLEGRGWAITVNE